MRYLNKNFFSDKLITGLISETRNFYDVVSFMTITEHPSLCP